MTRPFTLTVTEWAAAPGTHPNEEWYDEQIARQVARTPGEARRTARKLLSTHGRQMDDVAAIHAEHLVAAWNGKSTLTVEMPAWNNAPGRRLTIDVPAR